MSVPGRTSFGKNGFFEIFRFSNRRAGACLIGDTVFICTKVPEVSPRFKKNTLFFGKRNIVKKIFSV